jgi:PAS domain S-box-containing protein
MLSKFWDIPGTQSAQLSKLLERSLNPVCIYSNLGRTLYASPRFLELLQAEINEVDFFCYFASELVPHAILNLFWKQALNGQPVRFVTRTPDLSQKIECCLEYEAASEVVFLAVHIVNSPVNVLTQDYERAIAALVKTEEKWQRLVLNSPCLFIQTSHNGQILYLSPAVERLLGYKLEELLGQPLSQFLHPKHFGELEQALCSWGSGVPSDVGGMKWWWKKKSGRWVYLYLRGQRFPSEQDSDGIVLSGYNISDRKFLERKLRRYRDISHSMMHMIPGLG